MALFRTRRAEQRVAAVDAYQFPSSVRHRLATGYQDLSADDIHTVEAGARQWFRLAARNPRARLSMPSVVVDDLWHELVLHTRDYAAFCDVAFGRFLHHVPESAMSADGAAANQSTALRDTFRMAQQDEGCEPAQLPLLFRIDRDLAVPGGRHYLADCGGRGVCHELKGTTCLQHLGGLGRRPGGGWNFSRRDGGAAQADAGGCGGCGGGGCGGG
ncbi:glycine-rich domain-containing protein [Actinoplanes sp. NPDC049668]|uniref:glycine-rich domain-containing protein n=1 Tax=unclassified Actinoplanes TaxID=2626549 RepID=UPI0033AEE784